MWVKDIFEVKRVLISFRVCEFQHYHKKKKKRRRKDPIPQPSKTLSQTGEKTFFLKKRSIGEKDFTSKKDLHQREEGGGKEMKLIVLWGKRTRCERKEEKCCPARRLKNSQKLIDFRLRHFSFPSKRLEKEGKSFYGPVG